MVEGDQLANSMPAPPAPATEPVVSPLLYPLCTAGHRCVAVLPDGIGGPTYKVECDECKKSGLHTYADGLFYHCRACTYDVCVLCAATRIEAGLSADESVDPGIPQSHPRHHQS